MIRYDLTCGCGARFDGWFRSSADFDAQQARGLLSCPACGGSAVTKALMAPAIAAGRKGAETEAEPPAPSPTPSPAGASGESVELASEGDRELRARLKALRDHVTRTSENVGDRFPDLARRMHAEEIERRSIYGRATPDEARALAEDGVAFHPLPAFPDDAN
ncbi:hypothetical protein GCM10008171_19080 [Methylopila jiangsuensis]|uniref:DUF1178 family protein n=1 Tax=Methylopila jiangsuensis TaxID=586230 RepID=A0A9W6JJ30_9HYPH|nr:DUF1178 family protein [Methylopila jiangsuensis]MDR6287166.1 hypothetical protein [Methylopila jiangsuensis]GLK76654.1 hypothetical protein GCM10008171_19080 [Methylopila jiangsuensis]